MHDYNLANINLQIQFVRLKIFAQELILRFIINQILKSYLCKFSFVNYCVPSACLTCTMGQLWLYGRASIHIITDVSFSGVDILENALSAELSGENV